MSEQAYHDYLNTLSTRIKDGVLLEVSTDGLWEVFLDNLDPSIRQHYTCSACRDFVRAYGGLVRVGEEGNLISALWDETEAPAEIKAGIAAMRCWVQGSRVAGVFISSARVLGKPVTGEWHHFSVTVPNVWASQVKTAGQQAAEKKQDYIQVVAALDKWGVASVRQAVTLLKSDAFTRSEVAISQAEWLLKLQELRGKYHGQRLTNLLWKEIAVAPAGFCHPSASMVGTLLDDLILKLEINAIKARWNEKVQPLQYQRPTAAPSNGQIEAAEKIIAQLGAQGSLARRYAKIEEVQLIWSPVAKRDGTVFGHLKGGSGAEPVGVDAGKISWSKFSRDILPTAEEIWYDNSGNTAMFGAYVTAVNPDAPNILQWDNTFSWYVYPYGSRAYQWSLGSEKVKVNGLSYLPWMWNGGKGAHHGKGVMFILEGCRDIRYQNAGNGLFPSILKSEFHGIRATLEAYSRKEYFQGINESTCSGIIFSGSQAVDIIVVSSGIQSKFTLDRWE